MNRSAKPWYYDARVVAASLLLRLVSGILTRIESDSKHVGPRGLKIAPRCVASLDVHLWRQTFCLCSETYLAVRRPRPKDLSFCRDTH